MVSTVQLTWQAAQAACEALTPKSHLVVINNSGEEEYVFDQVGDSKTIWMGCSDDVITDHWVCVDTSGSYWRSTSDNRGYWGRATLSKQKNKQTNKISKMELK